MSEPFGLQVKLAVKGIRQFAEALDKAMISTARFFDALVDGGVEPPPGYWENRLAREIKWRSPRAQIGRLRDRFREIVSEIGSE